MNNTSAPANIDDYISGFAGPVQKRLREMRALIKKAAPGAKEVISYQMPAFRQNSVLVYFAAHTSHIGFYPTASGIQAFRTEFSNYKSSKGAVQFPIDEQLPAVLITRIVTFRLKEDLKKAGLKTRK